MARFRLGSALVLSFFFLIGAASTCSAADYCQLTICTDDDGTESRLYGEFNLWQNERWRLMATAAVPHPVADGAEEAAALALTLFAEDWRWTATAGVSRDGAGSDGRLVVRGAFDRMPWSLAVTGYHEDGELGLEGYLARRCGPWRLRLWQEVARADAPGDDARYAAEFNASWRGTGRLYSLDLGGSARRGAEAAEDERTLYGEIRWDKRYPAGWTLSGGFRWHAEEDYPSGHSGTRLSLRLARRAPLGIRLETAYARDGTDRQWRAGLTLLGTAGDFLWRAGAAGELEPEGPSREAWLFGVLCWRRGAWRLELGLTPDGEYASNSRHGYWTCVTYTF